MCASCLFVNHFLVLLFYFCLLCGLRSLTLPPPCSLPPLAQSQNRQVADTPLPYSCFYVYVVYVCVQDSSLKTELDSYLKMVSSPTAGDFAPTSTLTASGWGLHPRSPIQLLTRNFPPLKFLPTLLRARLLTSYYYVT